MSEHSKNTGALEGTKNIIAISSCKGGVGKSTVAAQLAIELARQGHKVGLVDADIHGPSVPSLFSLERTVIQTDTFKQLLPIEKEGIKLMSFGFLLGDAPAVMRGPIVTRYTQQILTNTAWGELDYLLIDMPPGTGDIQLTITQTLRLTGAIIVTTPQTLSLVDVGRGILMFEKVQVPILGIVQNMAYFTCGQCQHKHFVFGQQTAGQLKDRFGARVLTEWPLTSNLANIHTSLREPIKELAGALLDALTKQHTPKEIPNIYCDEKNITLKWPNGKVEVVNNRALRLNCRCAFCVHEISQERLLKEEDIPTDIHAKKITPIGNYAINIEWSDGHASGIYTYEMIEDTLRLYVNSAH